MNTSSNSDTGGIPIMTPEEAKRFADETLAEIDGALEYVRECDVALPPLTPEQRVAMGAADEIGRMRAEDARTCRACRHWIRSIGSSPGWAVCVWLTGTRCTTASRVDSAAGVPLRTHEAFGCNQWKPIEEQS